MITRYRKNLWQWASHGLGVMLAALPVVASGNEPDQQSVIVVLGAEGESQFGEMFNQWAGLWEKAATEANAQCITIGRENGDAADREQLQSAIEREVSSSSEPLWIVLIGHGTFDGRAAKFNLRGTDVSATELADWLKPCARPLVFINCSSCSSPFLNALSAPNRVIVTATRSGSERNFSRFGEHMAGAIGDRSADLDKDGQTSVLEAWLHASSRVATFYEDQARLATEHSLLDDTGDGLGTPADWFRGTRAVKAAKDGAKTDGIRAHQLCLIRSEQEQLLTPPLRDRRDALEQQLAELRGKKATIDEAIYYQQLEAIVRQLAELYDQAKVVEPR